MSASMASKHPPEIEIKAFKNIAGKQRYISVWKQQAIVADKPLPKIYVKLFMTAEALDRNQPQLGFQPQRMGGDIADAVFALLQWHGISELDSTLSWASVKREIGEARPFPLRPGSSPVSILDKVPISLDSEGHSTDKVTTLLRRNAERHVPRKQAALKAETDGGSRDTYDEIWSNLAAGNPVLVIHDVQIPWERFALIVGLEKVSDGQSYGLVENDIVYFAQGAAMLWGQFRQRWERRRPLTAPDNYGAGAYRRWLIDGTSLGAPVAKTVSGFSGRREGSTQKLKMTIRSARPSSLLPRH